MHLSKPHVTHTNQHLLQLEDIRYRRPTRQLHLHLTQLGFSLPLNSIKYGFELLHLRIHQ